MTRCFVIGPIGDRFAPMGSPAKEQYENALQVFEYVILPACAANNLEPVRADGIAKSGEITDQIFRHLAEDEVVIADVSGGNPNVMYELGLRHTVDLLTVQIGEYGQLPFDITAVRTIQFSRSDRGLIDARKALEEALIIGLAEGSDPVTATRIWSSSASKDRIDRQTTDETQASLAEENSDMEEEGFLDQIEKIEETFPQMTEQVGSIGEVLSRLGAEAESAGAELQVATAGGTAVSTRLTAIRRFSQRIQPYADELTGTTGDFAENMREVDGGIRGILRHAKENPELAGNAGSFLTTLITLAESSREGMEDMNQFAGIVRNLGSISKVLRKPGQQMAKALDTMASATAVMDDWAAEAQQLLALNAGEKTT